VQKVLDLLAHYNLLGQMEHLEEVVEMADHPF
jgi:hypothetical protein